MTCPTRSVSAMRQAVRDCVFLCFVGELFVYESRAEEIWPAFNVGTSERASESVADYAGGLHA